MEVFGKLLVVVGGLAFGAALLVAWVGFVGYIYGLTIWLTSYWFNYVNASVFG